MALPPAAIFSEKCNCFKSIVSRTQNTSLEHVPDLPDLPDPADLPDLADVVSATDAQTLPSTRAGG